MRGVSTYLCDKLWIRAGFEVVFRATPNSGKCRPLHSILHTPLHCFPYGTHGSICVYISKIATFIHGPFERKLKMTLNASNQWIPFIGIIHPWKLIYESKNTKTNKKRTQSISCKKRVITMIEILSFGYATTCEISEKSLELFFQPFDPHRIWPDWDVVPPLT